MHRDGHTLNVVITPRDMTVSVTVDPPVMSDQLLITATISSDPVSHSASPTIIKRQWTNFDVDAFEMDLTNSRLISCPPTNCKDYFIRYDETLCELRD